VIVVSDNWDASTGRLYQFSRSIGTSWQAAGKAAVVDLGRNGSAWGLGLHPQQQGPQKQEGDGKAPAGLFRLSAAFGALPALATQMPYQQMSRFDYCIDVPTSPLYNQTLDVRQYRPEWTAGSSEPMRRDLLDAPDSVYQQGLFIDHNYSNGEARQTGAGSCIFMHQKAPGGRKTAGCTALEPATLTALLQWLTPEAAPLYLLLPVAEYRRLQQDWQLPVLAQ
jgi:L,D-peptidoglycan transpeptidase YkuD (ErfK/YbiS/YcfS/YnhG family)